MGQKSRFLGFAVCMLGFSVAPFVARAYTPNENVLKVKNPFTVLGIDPLGYTQSDVDVAVEFWAKIFSRSISEDKAAWDDISEAARLLNNPSFVKDYLAERRRFLGDQAGYFFSVSPQEIATFLRRRESEMKRDLYNLKELVDLIKRTRILYEAFLRDFQGAPKEYARAGILEHFEKLFVNFSLQAITHLGKDRPPTLRFPGSSSNLIQALMAQKFSANEIKTYPDFVKFRAVAIEFSMELGDSGYSPNLQTVDDAISFFLNESIRSGERSVLNFLVGLSELEQKRLRYFVDINIYQQPCGNLPYALKRLSSHRT